MFCTVQLNVNFTHECGYTCVGAHVHAYIYTSKSIKCGMYAVLHKQCTHVSLLCMNQTTSLVQCYVHNFYHTSGLLLHIIDVFDSKIVYS